MSTLSVHGDKARQSAAGNGAPTPLSLAELRAGEVAATNALLRSTPLRAAYQGGEFRFEAGAAGGLSALAAQDYWAASVRLAGAGRTARVDVSARLLHAVRAVSGHPTPVLEMAQQLRIAVLAATADPLLELLEQAAKTAIDVNHVEPYAGGDDNAPSLRLHQLNSGADLGSLRLRGAAAEWLAAALQPLPAVRRHPGLARTALGVGLARVPAGAGALRRLRVGDVVLSDSGGEFELRLGDRRVGTAISDDQLAFTVTEYAMSEHQQEHAAEDRPPTGDITVEVSFDIGHTWLTLEEIAALQPGYVFHIDGGDAARVRIHGGGRTMGYGELVKVGDRLGVRLLEISHGVDGVSR